MTNRAQRRRDARGGVILNTPAADRTYVVQRAHVERGLVDLRVGGGLVEATRIIFEGTWSDGQVQRIPVIITSNVGVQLAELLAGADDPQLQRAPEHADKDDDASPSPRA